jgi:CDP-glycerol glycerophosphotransferase
MSHLISVIVPIYNVEPYLRNCLDSVVAQARMCTLDVVLVDDGSTDTSASIAEEYVDRYSYMRLIRKTNGGLGQARNVGASHARGDYLTFVDSDDVLPDGTYAEMIRALSDGRVDFATGNVVRLKGQASIVSAAHQKSHSTDRAATHISQHTGLLWDTTAWNKLFRRRFWEDRCLAFPEGVLYEDMELMTRSHLLARQVAVLKRTCYLWRIRTEWPPSITQCRTDLQNLDDRFTAIFALFETVGHHGTPELREAYAHKVLSLDMPIYVRHYGRNDSEQYRDQLTAYVKRALVQCTNDAIDRVSSVDRLKYWLIAQDRADEVTRVNRCQDTHFDMCPLTVQGSRVVRTYPTMNLDRSALPPALTDVTNELSPHTTVYDIRRGDRCLLMDVHAFVPGISPETSRDMVRHFYLKHSESGQRIDLTAEQWSSRVPTAMLQMLHFDGTWSRVTLKLPVDAFIEQAAGDAVTAPWDVWVDCQVAGLTWSDRVRRRDGEYMDRDRYVDCDGCRVRAYMSRDDRLVVQMEPMIAYAVSDSADIHSDALRIALPGLADINPPTLVLHGDHGPVHQWSLGDAGLDGSWTVEIPRVIVAMAESGLSRSWLAVRVQLAEYRVIARDGFTREWIAPDGSVANLGSDADGYLIVLRWQGDARVADVSISAHGVLHVRLDAPRESQVLGDILVELAQTDSASILPLRPVTSDSTGHEIDLSHVTRGPMATPVPLGEWRIVARPEGPSGAKYEPQVAWHLRSRLPLRCRSNGVCLALRVNDGGKMVLRVTTDWPEHADLHSKRRRLETDLYPSLRARPVTQSAVFESWGGTAFNDGPRRVYDELARRVPHAQMTWVVRDPSVAIPRGVARVLRGTKDYYEALAQARFVVSNSRMPEHFQKHEDGTYVRLGRGIPVKRIGTDVTGVASLAVACSRKLTNDAKQWDVLVTGHPHASCIFRRAFAYEGVVLEQGQPRLDGLREPDATARRERVRSHLEVTPSERLLLFSPTWRDNLFARPSRYVMPRALDFTALLDELGNGWRLLLKNHPAVGDRTGGDLDRRVIHASGHQEMTDLYLAADVLITDYSSAIFDFAVTGKPILVFAPDLEEYQERVRGVYWNMETELPGPLLTSTGAVIESLRNNSSVEATWRARYEAFQARYCSQEDGAAATRLVEAVFADWLD